MRDTWDASISSTDGWNVVCKRSPWARGEAWFRQLTLCVSVDQVTYLIVLFCNGGNISDGCARWGNSIKKQSHLCRWNCTSQIHAVIKYKQTPIRRWWQTSTRWCGQTWELYCTLTLMIFSHFTILVTFQQKVRNSTSLHVRFKKNKQRCGVMKQSHCYILKFIIFLYNNIIRSVLFPLWQQFINKYNY